MDTLKYFLKYVTFDTQSDDESNQVPSTSKQLILAKEILSDLLKLGCEARMDEYGQVYAFIKGEENLPTIGFNAHMDTAPDYSGKNVVYQIIQNYDGNPIIKDNNTIDPKDYPILNKFINKDLVIAKSDTLLGADDKAGISIIMNMVEFLMKNKSFKHHPISILFTCDEEIGKGADHFDNSIFKTDYAYTIDGDSPYIISYENFNAAHVDITIKGVSIHPGEAKNKLINAISVAMEFNSYLNPNEVPEKTCGYEGFHHLTDIKGDSYKCQLSYILRDHDKNKLEEKINQFNDSKQQIMQKYPNLAEFNMEIGYDYQNMKEVLNKDMRAIDKLKIVYDNLNLTYEFKPIRGGTDGATFSFKGCPTPNLGTGSYNHHGPCEFLVKQEHDLLIEIIKEIIKA